MGSRLSLLVVRLAFGARRFSLVLLGLFFSMSLFAQDKAEMADVMRNNGKIYVVVTVCLIILIGLFLYVMTLDRKMSRLEKNKHAE